MDRIYRELTPDELPWNLENPPHILADMIESGKISPCRAVDLGCGAGNLSSYLAAKGFDVTGVDISAEAIRIAREKRSGKGLRCNFVRADLLEDLYEKIGSFDFALDWEVLHHIFPPDRAKYLNNVDRILNRYGRYLSLCFSEKDPGFGGRGKIRKTSLGTVLYMSSESELEELFTSKFHVHELKTVSIAGKNSSHLAVFAFLEKR
jgi:SAM-dependent methyltransferase